MQTTIKSQYIMELKGKIIREEYFPYLVENGLDELGILVWIDYGIYFKVHLKSELLD